MPARSEVQKAIDLAAGSAQDAERHRHLKALHHHTKRSVVLYASAFGAARQAQGVPPSLLSILPEDVQGFMAALHGLPPDEPVDLILHSPGGSLEAAEQIVNYLRAKFPHIRAIVPQTAMSAATMLVCACDEVMMGKQSALGPIDPQLTIPHGSQLVTLPAQAILDEFEQAKTEILQNPKLAAIWIPKLQALPHGILSRCTTSQQLAEQKVETWLRDYMKLSATEAAATAKWLADAKEHKTHGRPICAELARQHHLKIRPLEADQTLQDLALSVFHATMVTFERTHCVKIFENHLGKGLYVQVNVAKA